MLKKSLITLALASILTGCGSSSDSGSASNGDEPSTATTYTVIDGYLTDAEVYVLASDGTTETLIGNTDANGQIEIPAEYADYTVIAKIIAGQTIDSDTVGVLTESYEMRGTADSSVVTPFTTLANHQQVSLSDLAASLGLDEATISGDYIKADSTKAHLVARTLAAQLDNDSSNDADDVDELAALASTTVNFIATLADDINLDEIEFDVNTDGSVTQGVRVASVADFINEPSWFASFNSSYFADESFQLATFSDEKMTVNSKPSFDYTIDNNKIISDGGNSEFIYLSKEIALSVTELDELFVWINEDEYNTHTVLDLKGQTVYYVADDSTDETPQIMIAKFEFAAKAEGDYVTITTEEGESEKTFYDDIDGVYWIELPESIADGKSTILEFEKITANQDMIMVLDHGGDNGVAKPTLLTSNKNLAENIATQWKLLTE